MYKKSKFGRLRKHNLKPLIESKVPLVVCEQEETRFTGYNVRPIDVFVAFPKKYTSMVESPLKVKDPNRKDLVILPLSVVDKAYFEENLNKFNKSYETAGERVYETSYKSLKEYLNKGKV
tara:strand:- start:15584 stop:15943 length:360 start_codon:yes stop_codon:yes gene_type:complete